MNYHRHLRALYTVAGFMYGRQWRDYPPLYNRMTRRNFWDKCPGCGE